MLPEETCLAILDTIDSPIVFVDNDHVIRYLNKRAMKRYYEERGFSDLIGKSLFDCHSEKSKATIIEEYERLKAGEDKVERIDTGRSLRFTTIAVRDKEGNLLGYYEKPERISG